MSLAEIGVRGYRSIRELRLPLRRLTVLIGGNGVGKTNLYRALELLQAAATGTLAADIAREGGLGSLFWAGGRNLTGDGSFDPMHRTDGYRKGDKRRLVLEARFEEPGGRDGFDPEYRIELGFPPPLSAAFSLEAQVKLEQLAMHHAGRKTLLLDRTNAALRIRDAAGRLVEADNALTAGETALAAFAAARSEIGVVRDELARWRFFHGFRVDAGSPLRQPSQAITSPLLAADGSNLAAVFATLRHIRQETVDLDRAIDAAFPGAQLVVPSPDRFAGFGLIFPEMPKRVFEAHELSDGTLHFLALCGALLGMRQPPFIALNEPEASLHPALLPILAGLIVKAAERSQIWVVTHSRELADAIAERGGAVPREVVRTDDGTTLAGLTRLGTFADETD